MQKKVLLTLLLLIFPAILSAQDQTPQDKNLFLNTQLHWDFHREIFTSTIEFFEMDKYGTTFFFTDYDFDSSGQTGSYFEVSRNISLLKFHQGTGNLSVQFNDGVLPFDSYGKGIPRTLLYGVSMSDIRFGAAYFEIQFLARQEFGTDIGWQFTGVWNYPIPKTHLEFLGYVDWNTNKTNHQPNSVQAEPQLLYRFGQFAVGSELEISKNFIGAFTKKHGFHYDQWYAHPTIFVRVDI